MICQQRITPVPMTISPSLPTHHRPTTTGTATVVPSDKNEEQRRAKPLISTSSSAIIPSSSFTSLCSSTPSLTSLSSSMMMVELPATTSLLPNTTPDTAMKMVIEMPSLVEDNNNVSSSSSSSSFFQQPLSSNGIAAQLASSMGRIQSANMAAVKKAQVSQSNVSRLSTTAQPQTTTATVAASPPISSSKNVPSSSASAKVAITSPSTSAKNNNSTKGKKSSSSSAPRRVVLHDYHDHSHEEDEVPPNPVARGGVTTPFPIHWHELLEKIESEGYGHVVSWQPHGRCFVIHNQKEFIEHVMPKYTKHSKFPSFRRQLNLYGYRRLTKGKDRGGYYHELFLRGRPYLARRMQRKCIKGTGVRCRNNPKDEPDFYKMEPVSVKSNITNNAVTNNSSSIANTNTVTTTTTANQTNITSVAVSNLQVQTQQLPPPSLSLVARQIQAAAPSNIMSCSLISPLSSSKTPLTHSGNPLSLPTTVNIPVPPPPSISMPAAPIPPSVTSSSDVVADFEGMSFHLMDDIQSSSFDNNSMVCSMIPNWQEEMESFLETYTIVSKLPQTSQPQPQPQIYNTTMININSMKTNATAIKPSSSFPPVEVVSDEDDDVRFGELLRKVVAQQQLQQQQRQ